MPTLQALKKHGTLVAAGVFLDRWLYRGVAYLVEHVESGMDVVHVA